MARKIHIALPEVVGQKYQVANKPVSGKFVDPKYGEINLYEITLRQADALVKRGFPYLAEKNKKTT